MDKIKDFKSFIKENINDDNLEHNVDSIDNDNDDVLMNVKNLPSELWTPDMVDTNKEFENNQQDDDGIDNIDSEIYEEGDDDKKMMHKEKEIELSEKKLSSEEEEYNLKNVFEEEEEENED